MAEASSIGVELLQKLVCVIAGEVRPQAEMVEQLVSRVSSMEAATQVLEARLEGRVSELRATMDGGMLEELRALQQFRGLAVAQLGDLEGAVRGKADNDLLKELQLALDAHAQQVMQARNEAQSATEEELRKLRLGFEGQLAQQSEAARSQLEMWREASSSQVEEVRAKLGAEVAGLRLDAKHARDALQQKADADALQLVQSTIESQLSRVDNDVMRQQRVTEAAVTSAEAAAEAVVAQQREIRSTFEELQQLRGQVLERLDGVETSLQDKAQTADLQTLRDSFQTVGQLLQECQGTLQQKASLNQVQEVLDSLAGHFGQQLEDFKDSLATRFLAVEASLQEKVGIKELRQDYQREVVEHVRSELTSELSDKVSSQDLAELRSSLGGELAQVRGDLRRALAEANEEQQRQVGGMKAALEAQAAKQAEAFQQLQEAARDAEAALQQKMGDMATSLRPRVDALTLAVKQKAGLQDVLKLESSLGSLRQQLDAKAAAGGARELRGQLADLGAVLEQKASGKDFSELRSSTSAQLGAVESRLQASFAALEAKLAAQRNFPELLLELESTWEARLGGMQELVRTKADKEPSDELRAELASLKQRLADAELQASGRQQELSTELHEKLREALASTATIAEVQDLVAKGRQPAVRQRLPVRAEAAVNTEDGECGQRARKQPRVAVEAKPLGTFATGDPTPTATYAEAPPLPRQSSTSLLRRRKGMAGSTGGF